jgi:predicted transcriptional regulator
MWKNITVDISKQANRLEIYHHILSIINEELVKRGTESIHIQYVRGMSDDMISKWFDILERKGLLQKAPLSLTKKGKLFLRDYDKIVAFLKEWNIYQDLDY